MTEFPLDGCPLKGKKKCLVVGTGHILAQKTLKNKCWMD